MFEFDREFWLIILESFSLEELDIITDWYRDEFYLIDRAASKSKSPTEGGY